MPGQGGRSSSQHVLHQGREVEAKGPMQVHRRGRVREELAESCSCRYSRSFLSVFLTNNSVMALEIKMGRSVFMPMRVRIEVEVSKIRSFMIHRKYILRMHVQC